MTRINLHITVTEICLTTGVSEAELHEIIGLGIVEPAEPETGVWLFDDTALVVCQRAQKLRQELELDWPGVAVTLSLLDEIDRLNTENRRLTQRLLRYSEN